MPNVKTILLIALIIALPLHAQPEVEWMRQYGDEDVTEHFRAHILTEDGGWAFSGQKGGRPANHWLVKTNADGEEQFQEMYNINESIGSAHDLSQTEDGGYVLAGVINSGDDNDASGFRVNAEGDQIWGRLYGGGGHDIFEAVVALKDDQIIFAGSSNSYIDTLDNGNIVIRGRSGYLVLTDGDGDLIWQNIYGGVETDHLIDVIVVPNGFLAVGDSESFGNGSKDIWVLRVDIDGEEVWSNVYGGIISEGGQKVVSTNDGGWAIVGSTRIPIVGEEDETWMSTILLKIDEDGEEEWLNSYPFEEYQVKAHDLSLMPDRGYGIVGISFEENFLASLTHILRVDVDGNHMWVRNDGVQDGTMHEYWSAQIAEDGGLTAAGMAFDDEARDFQGVFTKIVPADMPPIILAREPEDSIVHTVVGTERAFSVEARDPEGGDLTYQWILGEEEVGQDELVIINFPERGEFPLRVEVRDENWMTPSFWAVRVMVLIDGYAPEARDLTVAQGDIVEFTINPGFDPDSLDFLWVLENEEIGVDRTTTISFDELGQFTLTAWVMTEELRDSVAWSITVEEPDAVDPDQLSQPYTFYVDTPYPNPFNEVINVRFGLPRASSVKITLVSTTGQVVSIPHENHFSAGNHMVGINSESLTAGVYFLALRADDFSSIHKVVYLP